MILEGSRFNQNQIYPFPPNSQQQSQLVTPNFIPPYQSQIIPRPIITLSSNQILQPPQLPQDQQQLSNYAFKNTIFDDTTKNEPQPEEQFHQSEYENDMKVPQNLSIYLLNWLFYFLILVFILIIIVISGSILFEHQLMEKPKLDFSILKNVQSNLKQSLFIDIYTTNKIHNEHQQCRQGYYEASIGQWSGLKEGILILKNDKKKKKGCLCQDGQVQPLQQCIFRKDCKHIQKQNPINLYQWEQNIICVRKAKIYLEWNWVGYQECPNNQRKCSFGICVSDDLPCPITGFVATNENNPKLKLTKNFNIIRENSQPFVDFILTPGEKQSPCYVKNLQPQFQSKKFYPLARNPEKGCKKRMNKYAFTLDKQYALDVYNQNHLTEFLQKIWDWRKFSSPNTDFVSLQAIKRVELGQNPICGRFIKINFADLEQQGKSLSSFTRACSIILIIVALLALIIGFSLFLVKIKKTKQTRILFVFALILSILMIVTAISYYRSIHKEVLKHIFQIQKNGLVSKKEYLKYLHNYKCFVDKPINQAISKIYKYIDEVFESTELQIKIGLIITLIFLTVSVLIAWLQRRFQGYILQDPWE